MSKFKNAINNICLWLSEHMWLYWLLNFTWGIIMTLIGLIASFILICCGIKPEKEPSQGAWHFKIKPRWGGVEFGTCYIRDTTSSDHVNYHEYGHTFQNAIFGPLFPIIIGIPSVIRYWIFEFRERKGKSNPDYDSIWFEGSASFIGTQIHNRFENNKNV